VTEDRSPASPAYLEVLGTPMHSTIPTQHTTSTHTPLASNVILDIVTPREGQANGCDWCDLPSVVKVLEDGWLYYGCYMHGVKWFPVAMRQVSTLSLVKVTVGPDSTHDEYTKIRRMANEWTLHLLRGNNLCTLHSLIKLGH
jgi:hypothetical protein